MACFKLQVTRLRSLRPTRFCALARYQLVPTHKPDAQLIVVDKQIAAAITSNGARQDPCNILCNNTYINSSIVSLVTETVDTNPVVESVQLNDVFLEALVGKVLAAAAKAPVAATKTRVTDIVRNARGSVRSSRRRPPRADRTASGCAVISAARTVGRDMLSGRRQCCGVLAADGVRGMRSALRLARLGSLARHVSLIARRRMFQIDAACWNSIGYRGFCDRTRASAARRGRNGIRGLGQFDSAARRTAARGRRSGISRTRRRWLQLQPTRLRSATRRGGSGIQPTGWIGRISNRTARGSRSTLSGICRFQRRGVRRRPC